MQIVRLIGVLGVIRKINSTWRVSEMYGRFNIKYICMRNNLFIMYYVRIAHAKNETDETEIQCNTNKTAGRKPVK